MGSDPDSFSASGFKEHDECSGTALCGFGLDEGQNLVFLNQPAVDFGFKNRGFTG